MPHATPEGDVKETSFSLLILSEPVRFSNDSFPVQALLGLAAVDPDTHLDALAMVGEIFSEQSNVERLIHCTSLTEVKDVIK